MPANNVTRLDHSAAKHGKKGAAPAQLRVRRPQPMGDSLPLREYHLSTSKPPPLSAAESLLEKNLAERMDPAYQGQAWYERTWEFSQIWDNARRRLIPTFRSFFRDFGPRWQQTGWADFNQGRRQADAMGARYEDWVEAIFSVIPPKRVDPDKLHGDKVLEAYKKAHPEAGALPEQDLAAISTEPTLEDRVREILGMADKVYTDDPNAGQKLVQDSIDMGVLPAEAMDLVPAPKTPAARRSTARPSGMPRPKVII